MDDIIVIIYIAVVFVLVRPSSCVRECAHMDACMSVRLSAYAVRVSIS